MPAQKNPNPISISDVKHSPEVINIRLKNDDMPGWYAVLQMEPNEIAYFIEQKYKNVKKDKNEKETTFDGENQ